MRNDRILIAGIGNIFLGDDAFGVEVARRLLARPTDDDVIVRDFGIRGIDLTYALLEPHEAVILVDACPRGGAPGTLYVLEPEADRTDDPPTLGPMVETHSLNPQNVLRLAQSMGGAIGRVLLVGCEPGPPPADDDVQMELSAPVQAAVDDAVQLIESLVAKIRASAARGTGSERETSGPKDCSRTAG
jgi:hydrogenase maturation protease